MIIQTWPERLREIDDVIERHTNAGVAMLRKHVRPYDITGQIEFLQKLMRRRDIILHEAHRQTGMTEAELMRDARYKR